MSHGSKCAYITAALVLLIVFGARPALAQDGSTQMPPDPVMIEGRVVDDAGEGIADVMVVAYAPGMGQTLWWAQANGKREWEGAFSAVSDDAGRFAIAVPFAGLLYSVGVSGTRVSHNGEAVGVIAGEGDLATVVVTARDPLPPIRGRVVDFSGSCVADTPVTLVAPSGQEWVTHTDEAGGFVFDDIRHGYLYEVSIRVEAHGEIAPQERIFIQRLEGPLQVRLTLPATMNGQVRDSETGEGIAGATVIVSGGSLRFAATTGPEGWYELAGVPPGEYRCRAVSSTHADQPPRGEYWHERQVTLVPGEVTQASGFKMKPRAVLRGRVVDMEGQPVAGAMVGCPAHRGDYRTVVDAVFTDARGRFELRPGRFDTALGNLEAFHPIAGGASQRIGVLTPGEMRDEIELILQGTARITGAVQGPEGDPIPGIRCEYDLHGGPSVITDAQGRYDLGRVRLAPGRAGTKPFMRSVMFIPGRPSQGLYQPPGMHWHQPQADEGDMSYYTSAAVVPQAGPDGGVVADVTLHPTDLLTFAGTLLDAEGEPVPAGRVYLFSGQVSDADEDEAKEIQAFLAGRDSVVRDLASGRISGRVIFNESNLKDLAATITDNEGRWGLQCLRSDADPEVTERLRSRWIAPRDDGEVAPPKLDWVTVLVVWGEDDYVLYPSFRLSDEDNRYDCAIRCE